MSDDRLVVDDVTFDYPGHPVFARLSLAIEPGERVAIIGPNGSGKSTLVGLVCGALAPRTGRITLGALDVTRDRAAVSRRIALVPQSTAVHFPYRGAEFVAMGRFPYQQGLGFESDADRDAIAAALDATDTARFADRFLHELSGGERQRLLLARALAQDPDVLLLDEPTSHLDLGNQARFVERLEALRRARRGTVVFVTHDVNLVASRVDRLVLLHRGAVVADGSPAAVLTPDRLQELFGARLRFVPDPASGVPLVFPEAGANDDSTDDPTERN